MGDKKGFTPEQIIGMLRETEVLMSKRPFGADVSRKIGVTDVTFYRWRKLYRENSCRTTFPWGLR